MRILHTSDWHLGRQFHSLPLEEDHDHFLEQLQGIVERLNPHVLIIAGDIFDRANPPQSALGRFGRFIQTLTSGRDISIVAIAGNHDSAAQIGMMGVLPSGGRALVRGPLSRDEHPLIVSDEFGPVAFSALPFSFEFAARECFGREDINCPEHIIQAQIESARRLVPEGARWVVVAHAFVAGSASSDSERSLSRVAGGLETISARVFDGAHYVALGHLHRPQTAGAAHIRYSGAPLAFGFDEQGDTKSVTFVELDAAGQVNTEIIPLTPKRQIRVVRGKLNEITSAPEVCQDLTSVVLTDETPQIDPMRRIREKYPNAVQLSYERRKDGVGARVAAGKSAMNDPRQVVENFMTFVRQDGLTDAEGAIVDDLLAELSAEEGSR